MGIPPTAQRPRHRHDDERTASPVSWLRFPLVDGMEGDARDPQVRPPAIGDSRGHWPAALLPRLVEDLLHPTGAEPDRLGHSATGSPASLAWTIATLRRRLALSRARRLALSRAAVTRRSCFSCPGTYRILNACEGKIGGLSRFLWAGRRRQAGHEIRPRTREAAASRGCKFTRPSWALGLSSRPRSKDGRQGNAVLSWR